MAQRINEDIRFYLPADPYYYQVDNLPLEDLLSNDVRLQAQIDEINSAERGNTVGRAGFTELQPFIDAALPGTISVRPGNFIGRVQSTNAGNLVGNIGSRYRIYDGTVEVNEPPTTFGSGENPTGTYNVHNPPNVEGGIKLGQGVGRNSVIIFKGGNISIDSFNFNDFQQIGEPYTTTAPLGRLDLIGITTMNGAMDDPYLPGNPLADGVLTGDGYAKLAVVKGAGIVDADNGRRVVTIGEKFITIGISQERINDYGRDINGDVVPNPEFGTTPAPDDVVNVNFARNMLDNGEIAQSLNDLGRSNKNGNFFLPVAYIFVPQSHVEGNPIPEQYLKDIRPFFRTAELTYPERQAIVGALKPSLRNPFVTEEHAKALNQPSINDLGARIEMLEDALRGGQGSQMHFLPEEKFVASTGSSWRTVNPQEYGVPANATAVYIHCEVSADDRGQPIGHLKGGSGDIRVVRAGPGGDNRAGREDWDTNEVILPLQANGTFQQRTTGATLSQEYMSTWIRGYVTPISFPGF
jgi:hypothetical protein